MTDDYREVMDILAARLTADELINDIRYRIDRAIEALAPDGVDPSVRIGGKIDGLLLVKDWLRSYPSVSDDGKIAP